MDSPQTMDDLDPNSHANREHQAHIAAANIYGTLSHCERRKVGCVITNLCEITGLVNVISFGYNGTLPGHDNCCEDSSGLTLPHVIHAEYNALHKLDFKADGSTVYVTYEPCPNCADKIIQSRVSKVFYTRSNVRDDHRGIEKLRASNVSVTQISPIQ